MLITVFTPAYNRAYTLPRLYKSLCAQTYKDFEWVVVDDGSTDETESLMKGFCEEGLLDIRYHKVANGGKHRAINLGVTLARGEAFFIVDSDDWLTGDSLATVAEYFGQIASDESFAGVSGYRSYPSGYRIGGGTEYPVVDTDAVSIREKYHVKGDLAEVFKTSVMREYPFPCFEGEKFLSEGSVWTQIAQKYKLRYFYKAIYCCEYLEDGLTKNIRKQHRNSPLGSMFTYNQAMRQKRCLRTKVVSAINYWRYTWNYPKQRPADLRPPLWSLCFLPAGMLFYWLDIRKERKTKKK